MLQLVKFVLLPLALTLSLEPSHVFSLSADISDITLSVALAVGGSDLMEPEPFMASLRHSGGSHFCGGTLIHPRVVLTAAHCLDIEANPTVHIGRLNREGSDEGSGFNTHKLDAAFSHENYKSDSVDFDIALLLLSSASSREQLPLADDDSCFESHGGCEVRILGWGRTSERGPLADVIQKAVTTSVSRSICENLLGKGRITQRMICAGELKNGGIDACHGDSGGPLIQAGKQVGIVSFGKGCANKQSPGVYTSVPELRSWINGKLDILENPCKCAEDGISNAVPTDRFGCKQHLLDYDDDGFFCMTVGGLACPNAEPSKQFPGAAWISCQ